MTHTPGPWFASDLSQRVCAKEDVTIARCEPHSTNMAKANARLIAAAPELLVALDDLVNRAKHIGHKSFTTISEFDYWVESVAAAQSAIAKARGDDKSRAAAHYQEQARLLTEEKEG